MEHENRSKEELINELIQLKKCNDELEKHFKQTEIALKEAEEKYRCKLEQEVNQRTTELELNQLREKAVQKAEDKYRKLFNSIDHGVYIIDVIFDKNGKPVDYYCVEANEASKKIVRMDYANKYKNDIKPNYESNWLKILSEVASTGKSVRTEIYLELNKKWYSIYVFKIDDENNHKVGNIFFDITEQKEYEEKLDIQSKILSNIKDSIIVVDEKDIITYCNKSFVKLFGWQEQELIGHSLLDFAQNIDKVSKEKIPLTLAERQVAYGTAYEARTDEIICYSKNGTKLIVNINRTVTRDSKGEIKSLILSIRDVSERYKYQLDLKKSEEKFRYLFNSIDEGFAIIDVIFDKENKPDNFRFIELNPVCVELMKSIKLDVLKNTTNELNLHFETSWRETFGNVALTGEPIRFVKEVKILNIWIDAYVFKIDLEKGNKIGIIFSDITEKVIHNRKMEELIKMQDELYVNVSHELKTPLNVIFSANQVMDVYLAIQ